MSSSTQPKAELNMSKPMFQHHGKGKIILFKKGFSTGDVIIVDDMDIYNRSSSDYMDSLSLHLSPSLIRSLQMAKT